MQEITADPPAPRCYSAALGSRIQQSQYLVPDLSSPRARDARGRFAKGHSGNQRGRPPGIPNPKRRVPDLVARPLGPKALSDLLDRKPHLLRPLAAQILPPPLAAIDPAERLGIDLSVLRNAEDVWQVLGTVLAGVARGVITPTEGAGIARRVRARLRAARRLERLARRLAYKMDSVRALIG